MLPDPVRSHPELSLLGSARIGDKDRQDAIQRINEFYIAGFISHREWDARSHWLYKSRTMAELDLPFADLPRIVRAEPKPRIPVVFRWWYITSWITMDSIFATVDIINSRPWFALYIVLLLLTFLATMMTMRSKWKKKNK